MRAAIYTSYGPPEVVQLTQRPKPVVREKEILVRICATTVNRTDCGFRSAQYFVSRFYSGLFKPKLDILGNEFAGEVEAIGSQVTEFKPGDRVFGFNDETFGAHAEYMTIRENAAITTIPAQLSYEEAAPITEGGHYALCDIRAAKVKPGQKVLINGASAAIGSAAVQLLKYFAAEVTAVCGSENIDLVRSLKPDHIIDYKKEDFTKNGETYDFVFDAVGKSSYGKCKRLLKEGGVYISTELGKNSENVFLGLIGVFKKGRRVLFPLPTITKEDVVFLKKLVESGQFRPLIDRRYPFDQIVEAHRYVETGQKTGNVVIVLA